MNEKCYLEQEYAAYRRHQRTRMERWRRTVRRQQLAMAAMIVLLAAAILWIIREPAASAPVENAAPCVLVSEVAP